MPERSDPKKITFLLDSKLDNVSLAGVAVRGICGYLALSEIETYYLELCLVEAVNNAIKHAYDSQEGHIVEVNIIYSSREITFEVSDNGKQLTLYEPHFHDFDPEVLSLVPERGMGLHIIDSVIDEVTYRSDSGKNTLTMRKYLNYNN